MKGSASWLEFDESIKSAHKDIMTLGNYYADKHDLYENPIVVDKILDIIKEILSCIEHLDKLHQKETPGKEMVEDIEHLEELNIELLKLQEEAPAETVVEEEEIFTEEDLLEAVSEKIDEKRVVTRNYLAVEQATSNLV